MASLSSYITDVRRLLHDASAQFWTDAQLTDNINAARERVVRDTGCLRTLQLSATPISSTGVIAIVWTASLAVTAGQFIFSGPFIYHVTVSGTLDATSAPPYPSSTAVVPPAAPFANGSATLQYDSPCEVIAYAALPQGVSTIDVLNLTLFWGNSRIPLRYMAWTEFNAKLRYQQNYVGRPVAFSIYGQGEIYVGPVPDQSYPIELDTVILPAALLTSTPSALDVIVDPFTQPVSFYAAYLAQYYQQAYAEADVFKQEYQRQAQSALNTTVTRRLASPYSYLY